MSKRNRRRGRNESLQKINEQRGDIERLAILLRQSENLLKSERAKNKELTEQVFALRDAIGMHEFEIQAPTKKDRKLWVVLKHWGDPAQGYAGRLK
jgi:hypothetical protein